MVYTNYRSGKNHNIIPACSNESTIINIFLLSVSQKQTQKIMQAH